MDETDASQAYTLLPGWNNQMFKASVYGAKVSTDPVSKNNPFSVRVENGQHIYTIVTDIANDDPGTFKVYVTGLYVDSVEATVSPFATPSNPAATEALRLAGAAGYAGVLNNVLQFSGPTPDADYL